MKYIINEDKNLGIQSMDDSARDAFLKALGFPRKEASASDAAPVLAEANSTKMTARVVEESDEDTGPALYEWKGQYFRLEEDVYEFESELFVRVQEIPMEEAQKLSDPYTSWVAFDGIEYTLQEAFDYDDDVYIKLAVNEEMSDEEIDATMNNAAEKKFGKDSTQAKAHKAGAKNAPAKGDKEETPEEKAKAKADAEAAAK